MPRSTDVAGVCAQVYMTSTLDRAVTYTAGTLDGLGTDAEVLGVHVL